MGNFLKKQKQKLSRRQDEYDRIPVDKRRAFKRPGSMNPKKQSAGAASGKRR